VLENNPIDDDTTGPMDTITQKQSGKRKVKVKKKSAKMKVSAPEPDIPEKKSVKSNKQKKSEEYRRMKEVEKMVEEQKLKMEKDREKEQKKEEDNEKLVRQRVLPTYDVVSAMEATCYKTEKNDKQAGRLTDVASGAIPKQRKLIAAPRRTRDKDDKIEQEKKSSLLKKAGSFVETEERNVVLRKGGTLNIPHGNEELRSCKEYKSEDK
ncbi:unnamed protein product, partial [Pocillopora meandrina]